MFLRILTELRSFASAFPSPFRESPVGGGAAGGMVAHDLVNGGRRQPDGMSEANLRRSHH